MNNYKLNLIFYVYNRARGVRSKTIHNLELNTQSTKYSNCK